MKNKNIQTAHGSRFFFFKVRPESVPEWEYFGTSLNLSSFISIKFLSLT